MENDEPVPPISFVQGASAGYSERQEKAINEFLIERMRVQIQTMTEDLYAARIMWKQFQQESCARLEQARAALARAEKLEARVARLESFLRKMLKAFDSTGSDAHAEVFMASAEIRALLSE